MFKAQPSSWTLKIHMSIMGLCSTAKKMIDVSELWRIINIIQDSCKDVLDSWEDRWNIIQISMIFICFQDL